MRGMNNSLVGSISLFRHFVAIVYRIRIKDSQSLEPGSTPGSDTSILKIVKASNTYYKGERLAVTRGSKSVVYIAYYF